MCYFFVSPVYNVGHGDVVQTFNATMNVTASPDGQPTVTEPSAPGADNAMLIGVAVGAGFILAAIIVGAVLLRVLYMR